MLKTAARDCKASRVLAAVFVALALVPSSPATAAWRRPLTVAYDGLPSPLDDFSGFLSTRDGHHVYVVTLREMKGIVLKPVLSSGRLGRPTRLPGSLNAQYAWEDEQAAFAGEGQYPNAAVDGSGRVAFAWRTLTSRGEYRDAICNCAIRVDVGIPGRHISSITLSPKSDGWKQLLAVRIFPGGRVRVLYSVGTGEHPLVMAEIDKPWRRARQRRLRLPAQPIGESINGFEFPDRFLLGGAAGREQILVERSDELLLAQEPFTTLASVPLTWPPAPEASSPNEPGNRILLTNPHGLVMGVVANGQSGALEATIPATSPSGPLHRVTALPGTAGAAPGCQLNGSMNDNAEALVAWSCPNPAEGELPSAVLIDRDGHAIAVSPPRNEPEYNAYPQPAVWLDDSGHGIVGLESGPLSYRDLLLAGDRFSRWGTLRHGPNDAQSTIAVATTPSGLGLATWAEESVNNGVPWAARLRMDSIDLRANIAGRN